MDNVIDFSKYNKPTLTEEDLKVKATGGIKFKDGAWYKFRTVAVTSGVSKARIYNGEMPKGAMWLRESLHAITESGNLSVRTKDVDNYTTLWARTDPQLLKDLGYTDEMLDYVSKRGAPNTFSMISRRLWAFDPGTYGNGKDPNTGEWTRTLQESEALVKDGQWELFCDPTPLKGSEAFYKVTVEVENGFARVSLNSPRPTDKPPVDETGAAVEVLDPDA